MEIISSRQNAIVHIRNAVLTHIFHLNREIFIKFQVRLREHKQTALNWWDKTVQNIRWFCILHKKKIKRQWFLSQRFTLKILTAELGLHTQHMPLLVNISWTFFNKRNTKHAAYHFCRLASILLFWFLFRWIYQAFFIVLDWIRRSNHA